MKVEYHSFRPPEVRNRSETASKKFDFKGHVFVSSNIARYSYTDAFLREWTGMVILRTGEVFSFKCPREEFIGAFGAKH